MTDDRTIEDFVADTHAQLQVPVRNIHSRRAVLYKVSEDIAKHNLLIIWYETDGAAIARLNGHKLHREHIVPRGVRTHYLLGRPENRNSDISMESVERAVELFRLICWVNEDEKQYLNTVYDGWDAGHCMPPGWAFDMGDPWARYERVRVLEPLMTQWRRWSS
jgi:hypothetical protein